MTLWVGGEYLLGERSLILIVILLYLKMMGMFTDSFIKAYGIFQDVWAPVGEAVLSIVVAVILGSLFGLNGVLAGFIAGLFITRMCWKPFFLFRYGFGLPIRDFFIGYGIQLIAATIAFLLSNLIINRLWVNETLDSWFTLVKYALIVAAIYGLMTATALFITSSGLRAFAKRLLKILRLC